MLKDLENKSKALSTTESSLAKVSQSLAALQIEQEASLAELARLSEVEESLVQVSKEKMALKTELDSACSSLMCETTQREKAIEALLLAQDRERAALDRVTECATAQGAAESAAASAAGARAAAEAELSLAIRERTATAASLEKASCALTSCTARAEEAEQEVARLSAMHSQVCTRLCSLEKEFDELREKNERNMQELASKNEMEVRAIHAEFEKERRGYKAQFEVLKDSLATANQSLPPTPPVQQLAQPSSAQTSFQYMPSPKLPPQKQNTSDYFEEAGKMLAAASAFPLPSPSPYKVSSIIRAQQQYQLRHPKPLSNNFPTSLVALDKAIHSSRTSLPTPLRAPPAPPSLQRP